jgi:hypothetical protein
MNEFEEQAQIHWKQQKSEDSLQVCCCMDFDIAIYCYMYITATVLMEALYARTLTRNYFSNAICVRVYYLLSLMNWIGDGCCGACYMLLLTEH